VVEVERFGICKASLSHRQPAGTPSRSYAMLDVIYL
jgi:hypothetical protein